MASAYIDKISVGGKEYIISDSNTQSMIANAYNTAVAERYRFFSFGDAMLIL